MVPIPGIPPIQMAMDSANPSQPAAAVFGSYPTRDGIRLTPFKSFLDGPVAVFHFKNIDVTPDNNGNVGMQVAVSVERTGEFKDNSEHPTGYATATLQVVNLETGERSDQITFSPETSRTEPVAVNARYLKGGNFEVLLRTTMQGQNLGIQ